MWIGVEHFGPEEEPLPAFLMGLNGVVCLVDKKYIGVEHCGCMLDFARVRVNIK